MFLFVSSFLSSLFFKVSSFIFHHHAKRPSPFTSESGIVEDTGVGVVAGRGGRGVLLRQELLVAGDHEEADDIGAVAGQWWDGGGTVAGEG